MTWAERLCALTLLIPSRYRLKGHYNVLKFQILGHYSVTLIGLSSIFEFNPWWESGGIQGEFERFHRRMLFRVLTPNLQKRPIDVIVGLRRVGKTVLMYHLIDHLLKNGVNARRILYFSFDVERQDIGRIIREYEERALKARVNEKRCFLFSTRFISLQTGKTR